MKRYLPFIIALVLLVSGLALAEYGSGVGNYSQGKPSLENPRIWGTVWWNAPTVSATRTAISVNMKDN